MSPRQSRRAIRADAEALSRRRFLTVAGLGTATLFGAGVYLGAPRSEPEQTVHVIVEKTTAAAGALAGPVVARAEALADTGRGLLRIRPVGRKVASPVTVSLAVTRDGEREPDPRLRRQAVEGRLSKADAAIAAADVGSPGYNLAAVLQLMQDVSAESVAEVWLQTTILSSSEHPLAMTELRRGSAADAARKVRQETAVGRLDLRRVVLHLVLLAPIGAGQEPLSVDDEQWRVDFITLLCTELDAQVELTEHDDGAASSWSGASVVPPIVPSTPQTPLTEPDPDGRLPEVVDSAAFVKNTATLADADAVRPAVERMVRRYDEADGAYDVQVIGYTARYGEADSSRTLSRRRAEVIVDLLAAEVPREDITARGLGYDERPFPAKPPEDSAQRVVIMRLVRHSI